jgi:hypothetical protein
VTSEGPPSWGTRWRLFPWTDTSLALVVSVVALVVSLVAVGVAIVQTNLARDDAREARRTSTRIAEPLARKIFLDFDFDSVTVSNIGILPIHDVTLYRTDDRGKPVAVYEFESAIPGCTSYRWDGQVNSHLAVGFRLINDGLWLLSDVTGLHEQRTMPVARPQHQDWNMSINPIRLCS